ncbi:prolyl endopeptidase-like [Pholidichthys leucotaenia]
MWLSSSFHCYSSGTSVPSADHVCSGLEKYKDLQKYFCRRLKAAYRRFSNIPDHSVVSGHHYIYLIEGDGIFRMDKRQKQPEQILTLRQVEKLVLDNEETAPKFCFTIQRIRLSPQEKHLAVSLKCCHTEERRCVVVRLSKKDLHPLDPQRIIVSLKKVFSFEWATDDVLFYTTLEGLRSSTVFRLDLTSSENKITSVYEETMPDVFVEVSLSRDRQILTINCNSRTSSEVLLSDITTSSSQPFVLVQPRQQDLLYHVEHWRGMLIILANTGPGQEYQVVQAPLSQPSMDSWASLFVPGPGTAIKDMEVVENHCVLVTRTAVGELALIVVSLTHPKEAYIIQLPSWACAIEIKDPDLAEQQNLLEFSISSPVHPPASYRLYPKKGLLLSGTEDRSSPENLNYITTRLEACSQDGTLVPVTVFHAVPVEGLRDAPLLVYVYGAYGRDLNMEFYPEKKLLLEQGWALAYCHIRGGGECGLSWHRQARVEGKPKGVEDLLACLHHLFSVGVSSPSLTAVTACSAGAVPVGALCNKLPHLIRAVVLQAPFLDVLGTLEHHSLPLTLEDRDEWGDPVGNVKHRQVVTSYCPLHNISPQHYPSMLLTAYSGDTRVPLAGVIRYMEKLKKVIHTHFSMKLKLECDPIPNIILNIQPGANHNGPEDSELMLKEEALKLAFLYTELGLDPPQPSRKRRR